MEIYRFQVPRARVAFPEAICRWKEAQQYADSLNPASRSRFKGVRPRSLVSTFGSGNELLNGGWGPSSEEASTA